MQLKYQQMQEETERLKRELVEIEEKAKREKAEHLRMMNKQEEEKRIKDRFKTELKKVEKHIIEANECMKQLRRNVNFSYELVTKLPDSLKFGASGDGGSDIQSKQEIMIKVQNLETMTISKWSQAKFEDKLDEIKDKMASMSLSDSVSGGASAANDEFLNEN